MACRSDNVARVQTEGFAGAIRTATARFRDDEGSGGIVPRGQFVFEKPLEASTSDPTEIERGATGSSNSPYVLPK